MIYLLLILSFSHSITADDLVHNPIQYHSQTPRGSYNYGYDTGLYGSHQFHQENKDNHGVVRGRYGYTDPDGKLRLTYYTAGPDGYNVIKDTTASDRTLSDRTLSDRTVSTHSDRTLSTPVETVPVVHAAVPHGHVSPHARSHHAPLVVTAPCKYRNPPCHQARVHQEPEKVNTYSEKSTHHEEKITTEIRNHPPAPVVHAQSTPQEHNHHHLHHRNHDSHTQTTPIAPQVAVVEARHSVVEARHPAVEVRHPVTRVHHEDTHHSNTITKSVVDAPIESKIIHQAPIGVKVLPPVVQQIHHGSQVVHAIKALPAPLIVQTPVAIKAPPPAIPQQVVHQDTVTKVRQDTVHQDKVHQDTVTKVHRSPVQVYRGKTAVPSRKYEEYAKGRYVPNYKPSSPYSRCWCE